MKNQLKDQLTYSDLGGHRHLRRYVLATLIIVMLILAIIAYGFWRRTQERAQFSGASLPLSNIHETQTATALPVDDEDQTAAFTPNPPIATPLPPTPTVTAEACPTNPDEWDLVEIDPGNHLKRIEPACVYDGLTRTVAWSLLAHMGYTEAEAAGMMGFAEIPNWILTLDERTSVIKGLMEDGQVVDIELEQRSFHPDYRNWIVHDTSPPSPAIAYALKGCYLTQSINDGQIEAWGMDFPVVCVLIFDLNTGWGVHAIEEHYYTQQSTWTRRFAQFGYDSQQSQWIYMGWHPESTIGEGHTEYETAREYADEDRVLAAGLAGVDPWNTYWLKETYGFPIYPLPDEWQSFSDQAEIEFFIDAFKAYYEEHLFERNSQEGG